MRTLRVTSWNVKLFGQLLGKAQAGTLTSNETKRLAAIVDEIEAINADIYCVIEGPTPEQLDAFCRNQLGGAWQAILRPAGDLYFLGSGPGGNPQNILFMARSTLGPFCGIDPVSRWRSLTADASAKAFEAEAEAFNSVEPLIHKDKWNVSHPFLASGAAAAEVQIGLKTHKHHRHPQVLSFGLKNDATGEVSRIEAIGLHMKSKINQKQWQGTVENSPEHVREAVEARIKLTTEAINVRYYLDARFDQDPQAAIMLMGDLNDGPGRDLWEEIFLFHDLVGNLQGDVFKASRFMNHALFDWPGELRWTAEFKDSYNPSRTIRPLIDHLMFSQRFVRDEWKRGIWVEPRAGKVEHEIHGLINAGLPKSNPTSDHRPVSCNFSIADGWSIAASVV
jgi:hypothetical protein